MQRSLATEAYPIPCKVSRVVDSFGAEVQQFEATFTINALKNLHLSDKEFQQQKDILASIGLPMGKNFKTERKEMSGGKTTHFWRWDKLATWEATAMMPTKGDASGAGV